MNNIELYPGLKSPEDGIAIRNLNGQIVGYAYLGQELPITKFSTAATTDHAIFISRILGVKEGKGLIWLHASGSIKKHDVLIGYWDNPIYKDKVEDWDFIAPDGTFLPDKCWGK